MASGQVFRQLHIFGSAALAAALVAASSASAAGGLAAPTAKPDAAKKPGATTSTSKSARLGARTLRQGMSGSDVQVLRGIVRSKSLLRGSPFSARFDRATTTAVRKFQRKVNMQRSGVVNRSTAGRLINSLPVSGASWYGPGFWGSKTACRGYILRPTTLGVAHKSLPCGSKVLIGYNGRFVMTTVIDRGPFVNGRSWDLTKAASDAIGMTSAGVGQVRSAVVQYGR